MSCFSVLSVYRRQVFDVFGKFLIICMFWPKNKNRQIKERSGPAGFQKCFKTAFHKLIHRFWEVLLFKECDRMLINNQWKI